MEQKSWKTMLRRVGIGVLALWALVVLWGFLFAWRKVPTYRPADGIELRQPLMSGAEYEAVLVNHPRPYIVDITAANGGAVIIYGAEHTKDPNDPQIGDIQTRWGQFEPTVVLVESDLGILFPGLMDPVETFSEPGAVHALARRDGIPTYTWEPPLDVEMEALLAQPFSQEQIALYVILTPYFSNRRFGRPDDPEAVVAEAVRKRSEWPGIEGVFADVTAVNAAWQKQFPDGPDWRDVSDEFGLPGFLADIDGNLARDEHFVRVVIDLVNRGERVFAVAGSSHAVKLDAALRAMLNPESVP
jgi:hypothetical protein